MPPRLLQLTTVQDLLEWYRINLCNAYLTDPRQYRVRFNLNDFVHFIKFTDQYGKEPQNRRIAVENIRKGRISRCSQHSTQRAAELGWIRDIATQADIICCNWSITGEGDECYVKNFGGNGRPNIHRVLVCKTVGTTRYALTAFPCEIGGKERALQKWPQKARGPS